MSILQAVTRGRIARPRRIMLYGTRGIGKSTFAASAESPIFIPTEDGLSDIDTDRFPLATDYRAVIDAIGELYTQAHEYKTVVIDSMDWLEQLIHAETCRVHKKKTLEDFGFNKGYKLAIEPLRRVLSGLDALRAERGMTVILVAHTEIRKHEDPETSPYDRNEPRLHKYASALVQEWCDEVLFATHKVTAVKVDESFGRSKYNGVSKEGRILRTTERPSCDAKNRLGLPDEIPLDYRVFARLRDEAQRGAAPAVGIQGSTVAAEVCGDIETQGEYEYEDDTQEGDE